MEFSNDQQLIVTRMFFYRCTLFIFIFVSANGTERASIFFGRSSYVTPRRASRGECERSKCARSPTRHYSIGRTAVESDARILRAKHVPLTI